MPTALSPGWVTARPRAARPTRSPAEEAAVPARSSRTVARTAGTQPESKPGVAKPVAPSHHGAAPAETREPAVCPPGPGGEGSPRFSSSSAEERDTLRADTARCNSSCQTQHDLSVGLQTSPVSAQLQTPGPAPAGRARLPPGAASVLPRGPASAEPARLAAPPRYPHRGSTAQKSNLSQAGTR